MRWRGALSPTEKFEINQTSDFVISSNKQYKKRVFRFLGSRFLYFHPWYNVVVCLCSILYGPYPIAIAFFPIPQCLSMYTILVSNHLE